MNPNENPISEEQLKKNRRMAIILGISTGITLISIVFGFVQKGVAVESLKLSNKSKVITDSLRVQLQHCAELGELDRKIGDLSQKRADSLYSLLKKKK